MMTKEKIISELQHLPEAKLLELYDLIHYYRLGLVGESEAGVMHRQEQDMAGSLQGYAHGFIPIEQAKKQAWEAGLDEKYLRS